MNRRRAAHIFEAWNAFSRIIITPMDAHPRLAGALILKTDKNLQPIRQPFLEMIPAPEHPSRLLMGTIQTPLVPEV